jgi:hypothetical protein
VTYTDTRREDAVRRPLPPDRVPAGAQVHALQLMPQAQVLHHHVDGELPGDVPCPRRMLETLPHGSRPPRSRAHQFDQVREKGIGLNSPDPRVLPEEGVRSVAQRDLDRGFEDRRSCRDHSKLYPRPRFRCGALLKPKPPSPKRRVEFPQIVESQPAEVLWLADGIPSN